MQRMLSAMVYTNVWVSLGAAFACWQTHIVSEPLRNHDGHVVLFCGLATFFIYNFQRLVKLRSVNGYGMSERNQWLYRHRTTVLGLTVLSGLLTAGMVPVFKVSSLMLLFLSGMVAVVYAVPVIRIGSRWMALRDLPFIKLYLIAGVWAVATVLVPYFEAGQNFFSDRVVFQFIERFSFIIALAIPFDIRDMHLDDRRMHTIAQRWGVRGSLIIALVWLVGASATAVALQISGVYPLRVLMALLGIYALAGVLIWRTEQVQQRKEVNEWHYGFWLDGMIFLQAVAVWLVF